MRVYVCVYIYMYIYICVCMCVCIYMYIYIYICVYIFAYIWVYIYMHLKLRGEHAGGVSSGRRTRANTSRKCAATAPTHHTQRLVSVDAGPGEHVAQMRRRRTHLQGPADRKPAPRPAPRESFARARARSRERTKAHGSTMVKTDWAKVLKCSGSSCSKKLTKTM